LEVVRVFFVSFVGIEIFTGVFAPTCIILAAGENGDDSGGDDDDDNDDVCVH
jgi:hypothetical protein